MSIYEELVQDLGIWWDTQTKYEEQSRTFIVAFAREFFAYIGSPEPCYDIETERSGPPVALVALVDDDVGDPRFEAPGSRNFLSKDEEGFWNTGIKVTVPRHGGANQLLFWFLVRFKLRPDACDMTITSERREFTVDETKPATWKPVFDFMISQLRPVAEFEPWDVPKKMPIGFMPFG